MASNPITSWHIDGEKVETVADFIFLGSKITADSDCCQEIKRCLLLGRKAMTILDNVLKSRDITLLTQVCLFKAMVFPVVICGCDSWTIKKIVRDLATEQQQIIICICSSQIPSPPHPPLPWQSQVSSLFDFAFKLHSVYDLSKSLFKDSSSSAKQGKMVLPPIQGSWWGFDNIICVNCWSFFCKDGINVCSYFSDCFQYFWQRCLINFPLLQLFWILIWHLADALPTSESLPQRSVQRNRKTTEWGRLEISSRKLEIQRE